MGRPGSLFYGNLGDAGILPHSGAEAEDEACPGPRGQVVEKEQKSWSKRHRTVL